MKKIIVGLTLLFVAITVSSYSQTAAEDLLKDKDLNAFVGSYYEMVALISDHYNKEELAKISQEIGGLRNSKLSADNQIELISKTLKDSDKETFISLQNSAIESLKNISIKLNNSIDKEIFVTSFATALKIKILSSCGWRYGLCSAAVGVEGGLMLAACEAATLGAGTPFCIAGVVVWTANEILECRDKYC